MAKKKGNVLGGWAFLIGVILAVVFGFMGSLTELMTVALVILGLIVGLLNIADDEVSPFLIASAILVIVSSFGQSVVGTVTILSNILSALIILFVPATIIVALKSVFSMARN